MIYPTFTIQPKALNIASDYTYSPYSDIVWSFDYAISGNNNTEAGFTIFLQSGNAPLTGGNGNIDLGYSGLSSQRGSAIKQGVLSGVVAVGFDTTGLFAVSALSAGSYFRPGIVDANRILNSITIRNAWPAYNIAPSNYHQPISAVAPEFSIVEPGIIYKTIRARLGDVGQKLYVDYRDTPDDVYKNIFEYSVNLNVTSSTKYRVGVSFATPISANRNNAIGNIYIKNFHTEGSFLSSACVDYSIQKTDQKNTTTVPLPPQLPSIIPPPPIPIAGPVLPSISTDNMSLIVTVLSASLSAVNTLCSTSYDLYNLGVNLSATVVNKVLTRVGTFEYVDILNTIKIYKQDACSVWVLSTASVSLSNTQLIPISSFTSGPTTYEVKYI